MSGFCSKHQGHDKDCKICNVNRDTEDISELKQKAVDMDYCYTCKCNSNKFHLLRSFQIECSVCGKLMEMPFDLKMNKEE